MSNSIEKLDCFNDVKFAFSDRGFNFLHLSSWKIRFLKRQNQYYGFVFWKFRVMFGRIDKNYYPKDTE